MRILPEKPHFFKPLLPGFRHGLKIPQSFVSYLDGKCFDDQAMLRRGGENWRVRIKGLEFEEGWATFAEDNDLHVGDFLVFRHEGDLVFEVTVFDWSHCEKEYPQCKAALQLQEPNDMPNTCPEEAVKIRQASACPEAGAMMSKCARSHFVKTMNLTAIHPRIHIPLSFARENGLCNRQCEMILRDEEHRLWPVELKQSSNHVYIGRGWQSIRAEYDLKVGDQVMFELVENGVEPKMAFQVLRASPATTGVTSKNKHIHQIGDCSVKGKKVLSCLEEKDTTPADSVASDAEVSPRICFRNDHISIALDESPYFISTLRPYNIKYSCLNLPIEFARRHALINRRKLILRDAEKRSWPMLLVNYGSQAYIRRGWREFCSSNGIKEGDTFRLELVQKGKTPVLNFNDLRGKRDAIYFKSEDVASTSGNPSQTTLCIKQNSGSTVTKLSSVCGDYPYYISFIPPTSISKATLYIPIEFARSNGLTKNQGEMILIDKEKRTWSVKYGLVGDHVYIGCGWHDFCTANGLKEGDSYKFELIKKGETSIVNFRLTSPEEIA